MPQRFQEGERVRLKVEKNFSNPVQKLPAGSKGTILKKFSDNLRYRLQFDDRKRDDNTPMPSIIEDGDLMK